MAADRALRPAAAAVLLLVFGVSPSHAQGPGDARGGQTPPASSSAPTLASAHAWFDAGVRRPLAIVPSLRADFGETLRGGAVVLRPVTGVTKDAAGPLQSPVLRDESGRLRALPGGVLVVLEAVSDEASVRALLARYGVGSARPVAGRTWLIDAPAGLESLELANRLAATGAFASAQPNWWVERVRK